MIVAWVLPVGVRLGVRNNGREMADCLYAGETLLW